MNDWCMCRGHRRCRGTGLDGSCVRVCGQLVSEQHNPLFSKCTVLWELLPGPLGKGKCQGGKWSLLEGSRLRQHKAICGQRLTKTCLLSQLKSFAQKSVCLHDRATSVIWSWRLLGIFWPSAPEHIALIEFYSQLSSKYVSVMS